MRYIAAFVATIAAAFTLVGCAPEVSGESVASDDTSYWDEFHAQYPDVPKPETTVVRTVDRDEWDQVIAECLHEAGFPDVQADPEGGLSWQTSQAEAFALAMYVCQAQFPLDPKYDVQVTDEQLGKLYDYLTLVQVPCLEALGFDIPEAPSKARFVETYFDAPEWLPYTAVTSPEAPAEAAERAIELCPQNPPPGSEYDLLS
jgi:hypothetical protein